LLRIRLSRVGKKRQPAFRVLVADSRSPRDGAFVEIIGHYNPLADPPTVTIKEERAAHWLKQGAKPSEAAAKILARAGVMERPARRVSVPATKPETEEAVAATVTAEGVSVAEAQEKPKRAPRRKAPAVTADATVTAEAEAVTEPEEAKAEAESPAGESEEENTEE